MDKPFKLNYLVLLVIAIGVVAQNIVMYRGGMKDNRGFHFPSMHDTMWNIALTAELTKSFPPQHPGLSGEELKNNHYFYPLILAIIYKITSISVIDLYFRIGPILVSFLFGISLYLVSTVFTKKPVFQALSVFLGYFSGSFSYFLPLFYDKLFNWQGNSFLSDQPFDQLINPYSVLGFAFMLFTIYLSAKIIDIKRKMNIKNVIVFALIAGLTYGFKSFGGIIIMASLIISTLLSIPKQKSLAVLLILSLVVFTPVFFLITEPQKAGLKFAPGWLLTEMMVKKDGLNLSQYAQIEDYYRQIGNYLGLTKIKIIELVIYLIGNLGIRLLGLLMIIKLFVKKRDFTLTYLFFCAFFSLSIPLLFNLGANAHNIVQFTPYSLVVLAIMTGVCLERVYLKLEKKRKRLIGVLLILLTILMATPVNIKNIYTKLENPNGIVTFGEYEGLNYLKSNTNWDDIVLLDLRQYQDDPIYVSALSERRVYLASPDYARQTNRNPAERLKKIYSYFDDDKIRFDSFSGSKINYLYLHQPVKEGFLKKSQRDGFSTIYLNDKVVILKRL